MKTIGIIGSRSRDSKADLEATRRVFDSVYEKGDRIVSGHCPQGGDKYAEIFAKELGLTEKSGRLVLHRPDWDKHGKGAGFVRNTYIAEDADILIAVVKDNDNPLIGGTGDTIKKATKMDKQILLVPQVPISDFDPLEEI